MPRGAVKAAQTELYRQHQSADATQAKANDVYGALLPQLKEEASNPQGYSPEDMGAMNTASQQSIGGATAGAVGEGNLESARTRNRGGFAPALDEAVRGGERQLSQNALGVQAKNADLKQQKQQAALGQMQGLYGTNLEATLRAMGLAPGTINAWTNAAVATQKAIQGNTGMIAGFLGGGATGLANAANGNQVFPSGG